MYKLNIDKYLDTNGDINFDGMVNNFLYFENEDKLDCIKIIKYDKDMRRLYFFYQNTVYDIKENEFKSRLLSTIFKSKSKGFLYSIGDIVNDLLICDYTRHGVHPEKAYVVMCIKDMNIFTVPETRLSKGSGCMVCKNMKIVKGVNSIYDTDRWMCKYIVNEEDWYKYCSESHKKVLLECDICHNRKQVSIGYLKKYGMQCCNDGISYPNKFIKNILSQLKIKSLTEYIPNWSDNRRYDFYINEYNCIIEAHGNQHYSRSFQTLGHRARTLKEELENDIYKEKLAKENGIEHYIVLDCRHSEVNYIKKSIMDSELPKLLNFKADDIDWVECGKFACKNILKHACELWNTKEFKSAKYLAEHLGVSRQTINNYLNYGNSIGLCHYDGNEENIKSSLGTKRVKPKTTKKVVVFNNGEKMDIVFEGCYEVARYFKKEFNISLTPSKIGAVCLGKRKTHKGFTFKYID